VDDRPPDPGDVLELQLLSPEPPDPGEAGAGVPIRTFGLNLYAARKAAGLSQRELGRRIGRSQKLITSMETGVTGKTISAARATEIATALGLGAEHPLTRALIESAGRLKPAIGEANDLALLFENDAEFRAEVRRLIARHGSTAVAAEGRPAGRNE
jgi:transcriptional regulator with XRE-family HTH domain